MARKFYRFWIGLSQLSTLSGFVWSDGSPVGFANWNQGEPNNYYGENCVEMDSSSNI